MGQHCQLYISFVLNLLKKKGREQGLDRLFRANQFWPVWLGSKGNSRLTYSRALSLDCNLPSS